MGVRHSARLVGGELVTGACTECESGPARLLGYRLTDSTTSMSRRGRNGRCCLPSAHASQSDTVADSVVTARVNVRTLVHRVWAVVSLSVLKNRVLAITL